MAITAMVDDNRFIAISMSLHMNESKHRSILVSWKLPIFQTLRYQNSKYSKTNLLLGLDSQVS
jgi:hypothetical protein